MYVNNIIPVNNKWLNKKKKMYLLKRKQFLLGPYFFTYIGLEAIFILYASNLSTENIIINIQ